MSGIVLLEYDVCNLVPATLALSQRQFRRVLLQLLLGSVSRPTDRSLRLVRACRPFYLCGILCFEFSSSYKHIFGRVPRRRLLGVQLEIGFAFLNAISFGVPLARVVEEGLVRGRFLSKDLRWQFLFFFVD